MKFFKLFLMLNFINITACSSIVLNKKYVEGIDSYIENFPMLREEIVILEHQEMLSKCEPNKPKGKRHAQVFACSGIDLDKKTCKIYLPKNYEQWALEHEKEHCKGGDHDNILNEYHQKWINKNKLN